ncbi:MAG: beta-propeller domain-containing protein [Clostridiales Family XIII bacterium]|jgi:uncharacterized secreted protein with C-terminal beta-propeller domain|nr:beta-propeller domain-containing protein [Clostridiales Family XIII bacterium]
MKTPKHYNTKLICLLTALLLLAAAALGQAVASSGAAGKTGGTEPMAKKTLAAQTAPAPLNTKEMAAFLAEGLENLKSLKGLSKAVKPLPRAKSTEHLKTLLGWDKDREYRDGGVYYVVNGAAAEAAGPAPTPARDAAAMSPAASADSSYAGDYSRTNVQVEGVDEGDIVKTDGKYIYSLKGSRVFIYKAGGDPTSPFSRLGSIDLENTGTELYLSEGRLAVAGFRAEGGGIKLPGGSLPVVGGLLRSVMPYQPYREYATLAVYDVTDRANPKLRQSFEMEGRLAATRLVGDALYFVVNKNAYYADGVEITPYYRDSELDYTARPLPATEVAYFPDGGGYNGFMMVGAMDLREPKEVAFETFLNDGAIFYMNVGNLYVARPNYWGNGGKTDIYRFEVGAGAVRYAANGSVPGTPLNQYSMDEHNGYFRVAVTDWDGNRIHVLDADLNQVGATPNLAEGESIQSARFMGDMAYMVTYLQTDPLYAVDLTNPKAPAVLGELKIPGFSTYLHPVGGDRLVGFGRHTAEIFYRDEKGDEIPTGSVHDLGQKISLFDVSDPRNLKESDVMLLGQDAWSEAFTNPKALMVSPDRKLFGFLMWDYGSIDGETQAQIRLVGVDGDKLTAWAAYSYDDVYENGRLLCIGNLLYAVSGENVKVYGVPDAPAAS